MNGQSTLSDEELIGRAKQGDRGPFDQLLERYRACLEQFCQRRLNYPQEVEDAMQITETEAWEHLPELEHPPAFYSWLTRIAENACNKIIRKRVKGTSTEDENLDEIPNGSPSPETIAVNRDFGRYLRELIARLCTPTEQIVLNLRAIQELPFSEIATFLEMPEATARSHYLRARGKVNAHLFLEEPETMGGLENIRAAYDRACQANDHRLSGQQATVFSHRVLGNECGYGSNDEFYRACNNVVFHLRWERP